MVGLGGPTSSTMTWGGRRAGGEAKGDGREGLHFQGLP